METFKYMLDQLEDLLHAERAASRQRVRDVDLPRREGPSHSFKNLPIIIAGSAGGYLKQGQYVDAGRSTNASS